MENKVRVVSSWKPNNKRESEALYQMLKYELAKQEEQLAFSPPKTK